MPERWVGYWLPSPYAPFGLPSIVFERTLEPAPAPEED